MPLAMVVCGWAIWSICLHPAGIHLFITEELMNKTKTVMAESIEQGLGTIESINAQIEAAASKDALPEELIALEGNGHVIADMSELNQANLALFEDLSSKMGKEKLFQFGYGIASLNRTLTILMQELGEETFESELGLTKGEHGYELPITISWSPSEDRRYFTIGGKKVRRAPGIATERGRERRDEAKAKREQNTAQADAQGFLSPEDFVPMGVPQSRK